MLSGPSLERGFNHSGVDTNYDVRANLALAMRDAVIAESALPILLKGRT